MQGPKRVATILLSFIVIGFVFLDYWAYSKEFHQTPDVWLDVIQGVAHAPAQYRIGVIYTASKLAWYGHMGLRHSFTLIDLVTGFIAVFSLFYVVRHSAVYRRASLLGQWFGAAVFIVLAQYYFTWLLWYQRPETLTTSAILALVALLLTKKLRTPLFSMGALILLALAQGFVRADVALATHVGILIVCLMGPWNNASLRKGWQILTSILAIGFALAIQLYMMRIRYPHATYGDTPVLQVLMNLHPQTGWVAFFTFITPFAWTFVKLARTRWQAEAPLLGILAGAVTFMGMWLVVGRVEEVRIFLPFGLAVAPLTTILAMQYLASPLKDDVRAANG